MGIDYLFAQAPCRNWIREVREKDNITYGGKQRPMWRSSGAMCAINGGGYDFLVRSDVHGIQYEDVCFNVIAHRIQPDHVAIGPHLTDILFFQDTSTQWGNMSRPDAMVFRKYSTGTWQLTMLAEMKFTRMHGMQQKLSGFSQLLARLRQESSFLPHRLREYTGDMVDIPRTIMIPRDPEVNVLFVAPFKNGADSRGCNTEFPVTFLRVSRDIS